MNPKLFLTNAFLYSKAISCGVLIMSGTLAYSADTPPFRMSLEHEPQNFAPETFTEGESSYILENLYRGLTRLTDDGNLIFDQAEKCTYERPALIICRLRKEDLWSDGSAVTGADYVAAFTRLIQISSKFSPGDLLRGIKNAELFRAGQTSSDSLGLKAPHINEIEFTLEKPDQEFLEKLASPFLVPYKPSDVKGKTVFNGPFQILEWIKKSRMLLMPNSALKNYRELPKVEIRFLNKEKAAESYLAGTLDFLIDPPISKIGKIRDQTEVTRKSFSGFDYIGFNLKTNSPLANVKIRQLLLTSLNTKNPDSGEMVESLQTGCAGLGDYILPSENQCQNFNKSPELLRGQLLKGPGEPRIFLKAALGSNAVDFPVRLRQLTWLENQWKKLSEFKISNVAHTGKLSKEPLPDIFFRKVFLQRPTCLAALELFEKDNAENIVGFENARFETLVKALHEKKMSQSAKQGVCAVALSILFKEEFVGIPLGPNFLTVLSQKKFRGWRINQMNQLDLSELRYESGRN